ncbi:hypothetical protein [Streptomyces sp. NPDC002790]|uniref:hypothetical protein n=1 Tax=Streptomyces sp. NPDC002790 TaxID=3154431 RepID=UPI00333445D9
MFEGTRNDTQFFLQLPPLDFVAVLVTTFRDHRTDLLKEHRRRGVRSPRTAIESQGVP